MVELLENKVAENFLSSKQFFFNSCRKVNSKSDFHENLVKKDSTIP